MDVMLDRRQFLVSAGAVACMCMLGTRFTLAEQASPVAIGHIADYARDGMYESFRVSHGFVVVRAQNRLYAISAKCTHKNLPLTTADGHFRCPAHGASFSETGKVERGPARKSLPRLGIAAAADGAISVNPSRQFAEPQWDQKEAYIDLRP